MPEARPPSSGRADDSAMPRLGMNASDIPAAAITDAGSTSAQNDPSERISDNPDRPAVRIVMPVARVFFGPIAAIAFGATTIMPSMMNVVIGNSADPLGNAL